MDLRQFLTFCDRHQLKLFEVRRSDIESFGRELKANGRATATIAGEAESVVAKVDLHVRLPRRNDGYIP